MARKDDNTVAVTLAGPQPVQGFPELGAELLLHHFSFEGDAVTTGKLHFRQLSPGVMEIASVAYSVGEWTFHVRDSANYFGLGERFNSLNHARSVLRNLSQDNGNSKGSSTYKPMPFFMSTRGYGLWVDTTAEATFDMNAGSNTDVEITVPAEKLRVVVFTTPEFPKILDAFTALAGRPILPPMWSFAPWVGRDVHRNDADVLEDVDRTRALGLPGSIILIDSPWATSYNSYKFNPKQFTDAPATVKHLHDAGFKLVLWHTPWINSKSNVPGEPGFADKVALHAENYDEAAEHGYFVKGSDGKPFVGRWWKGEGSMVDFTNPAAKRWWQDQVRQAIKAGADGFKDDDAEGNFQGDVRFADGTDKAIMRNRFAVLYNNAMEELMQKDLKGNGVLFARSVTQGANGIGFLWGGDNEASFNPENGLPSVVTAGLNAGMSGMPYWTADLGGYIKTATTPDPELLMRWTEYAAFSPTVEVLSQSNTQPWNWDRGNGTRALDTYRKFAVLHMSLFPYRYVAAQAAVKTGMPIMRALPLLFQNDQAARTARDEYMFGPDLLVAPITDQNTRRVVYLPAGEWIDLWTGKSAGQGGRSIVVDVPLDSIAVFARVGAVLPKIPEDVMTLVPEADSGNKTVKSMDDRRIFEILDNAPGARANFTDFEGRTVDRTGTTLKIAGKPARATVRWRFGGIVSASLDGNPLTLKTDGAMRSAEFDLKDAPATITWQ